MRRRMGRKLYIQASRQQDSSYAIHSTTVHNGKTMLTAAEKKHHFSFATVKFKLIKHLYYSTRFNLCRAKNGGQKTRNNRERAQAECVIVD